MSSELELHEAGRLKLAFLIAQEKARPVKEAVKPAEDLSYLAAKVLASEEKRLRESGQKRRRA